MFEDNLKPSSNCEIIVVVRVIALTLKSTKQSSYPDGLFFTKRSVCVGHLVWIGIHKILNLAIIKSVHLKRGVALQPHSSELFSLCPKHLPRDKEKQIF